jgi:phospholipid-binding lipoprotein MlaA
MYLSNALRRATNVCLGAVICVPLLTACAMPPPEDDAEALESYREVNDPLEPFNRYVFEVNLALDKLLVRPVAEIYRGTLPQPVQDGVRNSLDNLDVPLTFINDLLQGEVERAGQSFGRFGGNTLYGVAGVFDVMKGAKGTPPEAGVPPHEEDLGQTFAVWGMPEGPYLMLPVLGPSSMRHTLGRVGDSFMDPVSYIPNDEHRLGFTVIRKGLSGIDLRARNIETLDDIERSSIDYYAAIRSLYRQNRAAKIANGRAPATPLPDLSSEFEEDQGEERVSAASE